MPLAKIPVRADLPSYEFRIDLDGSSYTFVFRFNERMGRWIMDIKTENNEPVLLGSPVLIGSDFLTRFQSDLLPPGELFSINLKDNFVDSDREAFGNDVIILYNEAGTA